MSGRIVDLQVRISANNKLSYTTPDNQTYEKQYPASWTEQQIMDDFIKALRAGATDVHPGAEIEVKSVTRIGEA